MNRIVFVFEHIKSEFIYIFGFSFFFSLLSSHRQFGFRVRPDGEGLAPVLVTHNDGLVSMSFDWLSKQLYYVDNIRNSLEVVKITEQVKFFSFFRLYALSSINFYKADCEL